MLDFRASMAQSGLHRQNIVHGFFGHVAIFGQRRVGKGAGLGQNVIQQGAGGFFGQNRLFRQNRNRPGVDLGARGGGLHDLVAAPHLVSG